MTNHIHLVPNSRMRAAIPLLPQYAFMERVCMYVCTYITFCPSSFTCTEYSEITILSSAFDMITEITTKKCALPRNYFHSPFLKHTQE